LRQELASDCHDAGFSDPVFSASTTELIGYGEAAEQLRPVWHASGTNPGKAAERHEYEDITREYLSRFQNV
jgi:hypothetical protein